MLVGKEPSRTRFTVHQDLIVKRSEFFRAARSSLWTSPDVPTTLGDEDYDPEVISAYLHCLYFGADAIRDHLSFFDQQAKGSHSESSEEENENVSPMKPGEAQRTVFISNIGHESHDMTRYQFVSLFDRHAVSVYQWMTIATHPDGRSKGWANILFFDAREAARAIQLCNGRSLGGRRLRFELATSCHGLSPLQNPLTASKTVTINEDQNGSKSSSSDSSNSNEGDNSSSEVPESRLCDHRGRCQHFASQRKLKFLADLYLLADKFIDPLTANLTMDVLTVHLQTDSPGSMLVKFVYDSTTPDNPLRRLIRDWYIHRADYDWVDGFDKLKHHDEFVHDVVREVWTLNRVNLDKSVRSVYESSYMNQPGDRYHQRVDTSTE